MHKGITPIIAEILLVGVVLGMMSSFYLFYQSTMQGAMGNVKEEGKTSECIGHSSIVITGVLSDEISIRNNGGIILNSSHFSAYINGVPVESDVESVILRPGDEINLTIGSPASPGDRVKILGECGAGDEFYLR
ncbi:MAG: hypothetical protein ACP5E4_00125 [Candidatus Aenigmatarchaeota archaeon]